ncbi:MAG: hypothetical protein ABIH41_01715 [Nanoarchaeota archaeon]
MLPDPRPGDMERQRWSGSRLTMGADLAGRVLKTFEELQALMPADEKWREVQRRFDGYPVYLRPSDLLSIPVAYDCDTCGIVIGAPRIKDVNTLAPLAGRKGYDVYCGNCNTRLYSHTSEMS